MATIQSMITLKDGMSPVLRAIEKSLTTVVSRLDRVSTVLDTAFNPAAINAANTQITQTAAQVNRVEQEVKQVGTALDATTQKVSAAATQMNRVEQEIKQSSAAQLRLNGNIEKTLNAIYRQVTNQIRLTASMKKTPPVIAQAAAQQDKLNNKLAKGAGHASQLWGKVKGMVGAYMGMQAVGGIVKTADSLTQTTARLNLMNDGLQTTAQLEDKIYQAAMRSNGGFLQTADAVAKLGLRAGNMFKNNEETIAFTETLNKMFQIAGASQEEMSSATLQLTQALGSGVLRGEEFNAVFEAAPNVMQAVADYIKKPIGSLKELASKGKISAEVVKNALFAATDKVNEQFKTIPITWGNVWTLVKNYTIKATRPILQAISNITRNKRFIAFANEMGNIISKVAGFIKNLFTVLAPVFAFIYDMVAKIYNFIADNWSLIAPIIGTIAAAFILLKTPIIAIWVWTKLCTIATKAWTAAQAIFNAVMAMNPVGLVCLAIIVLIGLIYLAVAAINKACDTTYSATGFICGCLMAIYATAWNAVAGIWNYFAALIEFMVNVWKHPEYAARKMFANLVNLALDGFIAMIDGCDEFCKSFTEGIVDAINTALKAWNGFVEALSWVGLDEHLGVKKADMVSNDYSSGADALRAVKGKVENWVGEEPADYWTAPRMEYKGVMENYMKGYNWGSDLSDKVGNFFSGKNFKELMGDDLRNALENGLDKYGNPTGAATDDLNDIGKALSGGLGDNPAIKDIAAGVDSIDGKLDASTDDLSFMRDLAEQRAINRYYYTDTHVTQNNNNNISNGMDLNSVVEGLRRKLVETLNVSAEGVHY